MTATNTQARDDMYQLIVDAWGNTGPIDFEDRPRGPNDAAIPPTTTTSWLRLQVRHNAGAQVTLASDQGSRRFRRYGTFTIQVFSIIGTSLRSPESDSKIVVDALEGVATPHGVLIRNVRTNEVGSDGLTGGQWYQTNVLADFEYDEVK